MGVVAVLQPRDCLTDRFSISNILAPPPPQRPNKPTPNRRRRSPPPSKESKMKKKNLNPNHVRILKRGEEKAPDLKSARQIVSDPVMIPSHNRRSTPSASFYAGPVTSSSPPPSEVPMPAFFAKRSVSSFKSADATTNLIRILGLDIA